MSFETVTKKLDTILQEDHFFTPWAEAFEKKTGVKRIYLAYAIIGFVALYLIFGYFAELVCNAIGFVWPAYQSIKALESSSKDDDTKWLMYWVTFAAFNVVEFFSDKLLDWFPIYWLVKVLFLVWLFMPIQYNGSYVIYNKFIRPFVLRNESNIDKVINKAQNVAESTIKDAANFAKEKGL